MTMLDKQQMTNNGLCMEKHRKKFTFFVMFVFLVTRTNADTRSGFG